MIALTLYSQGKIQYTGSYPPLFSTVQRLWSDHYQLNQHELTAQEYNPATFVSPVPPDDVVCCLLSNLKVLEFSVPTHVWQPTASARSSADSCLLKLPMWITHCKQMLTRKDKPKCFASFPHQTLSLENLIDVLCMRDWPSEQKNKWENACTPNTGGTFGSPRSFYHSHVAIPDSQARTLLLLINIYAFSLSALGTENPMLFTDSLCLKL